MGTLNARLTCSLLTVIAIVLVAILPATRDVFRRQIWILGGVFPDKLGIAPSDFIETNGSENDRRILVLLHGFERIPVESRSFELAKIASKRKDPALWAHTIRQTAMVPVQRSSSVKLNEMDRLRIHAIAEIQLRSAEEGAKLDPDNVFFTLTEAVGLANLGKWDEMGKTLEVAGSKSKYDDYASDELRRKMEHVQSAVGHMLPSDMGREWSMIMFPHLSGFKALSDCLASIKDPGARLSAGLGLARAGLILEKDKDIYINSLSGTGYILSVIRKLEGPPEAHYQIGRKLTADELASKLGPYIQKLADRAAALNLTETAKGWNQFKSWKRPMLPQIIAEDVPTEDPLMFGVQALLAICLIGGLSAVMWVGSHIEPSIHNIFTIGCLIGGIATLTALAVEDTLLLAGLLWSSTAIFCAFLIVRLPGKEKLGYILAAVALGLVAIPAAISNRFELLGFVLGMWIVPFVLTRWVKRVVPRPVIIFLTTAFFICALAFFSSGLGGTPNDAAKGIGGAMQAMAAITAFFLPLVVAFVMSMGKLNLRDGLKLILAPMPLIALVAVGAFLWGLRDQLRVEQTWAALAERELSPKYKEMIRKVEAEPQPGP